jgi:Putative adhesin
MPNSLLKEPRMATSTARFMLLLAALLGTSVALAAQRTYDKTLTAPPGGQLTFDTVVGSVAIVGHDVPAVVIHAELRGPESFLNQIRISAKQTPAGVAVSAHGAGSGLFDWFHWSSGSNRVQFTIEVPRNYPVDLRTAGGSVQVRDLNAAVHAQSSGGSASVQNIAGAINLSTSGGSITVQHLAGPADLSSSGGSVDVTDSVGDLDVNTEGGGVRLLNDDGKIHARTSGGSARAELQVNRGISLHTSGGGITLLLPQDAHGSIDATSDGGGISFDFPLSTTRIDGDNHLAGTIGGGGPAISLQSSGGGIRVAPDK